MYMSKSSSFKKTSMHGKEKHKEDLTIYIQIYSCGKPYACNVWFNQVLKVKNLNENLMVNLQFNSIIIENYGIKYLNKINLIGHFLINHCKKESTYFSGVLLRNSLKKA